MNRAASSSRPIKVMHIIARLNIGGAAIYVIQLTAGLGAPDKSNYSTQLVCGVVGQSEGDMRYIANDKQIPVTVIPSLGREISPTGDLFTLFRLWRLIRQEKPDIVHTHTAKAGFVGRVAAWLASVPVIVHTFHGHVLSGYFSPAKTRVFLELERLCARMSTALVTLSESLKHELSEVYHVAPADRFAVIALGFELAPLAALTRHQGDFRQRCRIPEQVPLVGIVGRLVPIKNHDLFLQAAKLVHERLPEAHFAIVGDGERRAELGDLTRTLGLENHVHFTGWVTDTGPMYSALDVVVLSSNNEGLPVSLIEAMAAGVPVVATDVGGVRDLLAGGQLGAIVPPQDVHSLAEAIFSTLTDPAAQGKVGAARQMANARYDIQVSIDATDALYRRLLAKRGIRREQ